VLSVQEYFSKNKSCLKFIQFIHFSTSKLTAHLLKFVSLDKTGPRTLGDLTVLLWSLVQPQ